MWGPWLPPRRHAPLSPLPAIAASAVRCFARVRRGDCGERHSRRTPPKSAPARLRDRCRSVDGVRDRRPPVAAETAAAEDGDAGDADDADALVAEGAVAPPSSRVRSDAEVRWAAPPAGAAASLRDRPMARLVPG